MPDLMPDLVTEFENPEVEKVIEMAGEEMIDCGIMPDPRTFTDQTWGAIRA
jgi:hypothetical protein